MRGRPNSDGDSRQLPPIGPRIAEWIRRTYPQHAAKLASQQFQASHHTSAKWLKGHPPSAEHLEAMCRTWGYRFIAFITETEWHLRDRIQANKRETARIKRRISGGKNETTPDHRQPDLFGAGASGEAPKPIIVGGR